MIPEISGSICALNPGFISDPTKSTDPISLDRISVVFSFPVDIHTLDTTGKDFAITLADDTQISPRCAIMDPHTENNEGQVVTLFGHFGAEETKKIEVIADSKLMLKNPDNTTEVVSAGNLAIESKKMKAPQYFAEGTQNTNLLPNSKIVML